MSIDDLVTRLFTGDIALSPRMAKRNLPATEAAHFKSDDSFVALDGSLRLADEDWRDQKYRVFTRDKGKCRECGTAWLWIADVHHVIRRSDGGSDDLDNLVLLCRICHGKQHPEKQVRLKWIPKETSNGE